MSDRLGDAPIQAEYRAMMNDLARAIDQLFNGDISEKQEEILERIAGKD